MERVPLGSDMLGLFSLAFLDSGRADQTEIVSKRLGARWTARGTLDE